MSLDDGKIDQEIRAWRDFQNSLRSNDRERFRQMMNQAYRYASSIQATPDYEQDIALLLSLVFDQHKMIEWLKKEKERLRKKTDLS